MILDLKIEVLRTKIVDAKNIEFATLSQLLYTSSVHRKPPGKAHSNVANYCSIDSKRGVTSLRHTLNQHVSPSALYSLVYCTRERERTGFSSNQSTESIVNKLT